MSEVNNKQKQQPPLEDIMADARDLFMDAELEQAMAKFKEAASAAAASADGKEGRWTERLAAETGQAEVFIQQKDWTAAADHLAASIAAVGGDSDNGQQTSSTSTGDAEQRQARLRDLTRARYMLGIALLGQRKPRDALAAFQAARDLAASAEDADDECRRILLPDIQDRLAELEGDPDSAVEFHDEELTVMAMEFGMTAEDEEDYEEGDLDDEEEEEDDDDGEEEDEAAAAARFARKRRAAAANGSNDDDEDDDDEDDEEDEEDDDEEEQENDDEASGGGVPKKRARRVAAAAPAARNRNGSGKGDDDDDEEEEDEEVSLSA